MKECEFLPCVVSPEGERSGASGDRLMAEHESELRCEFCAWEVHPYLGE